MSLHSLHLEISGLMCRKFNGDQKKSRPQWLKFTGRSESKGLVKHFKKKTSLEALVFCKEKGMHLPGIVWEEKFVQTSNYKFLGKNIKYMYLTDRGQ